MKEYVLDVEFGTWQNQLWFMNLDDSETKEKWQKAIEEINLLKSSYENAMEFQDGVIEYMINLGFIRIQK